jgi:uncharacterized damage-inducible protein DinB
MPIGQAILPEFDHEMASTRRTLERLPEDKFDWKPHAKSTSLGQLAQHLAMLAGLGKMLIETQGFDMAQRRQPPAMKSRAEVLAAFDKNVPESRAAIAGATDELLLAPWSLTSGGKEIFTLPRIGAVRTMVLNHMIHHRAQMGVYLRLNDVPVPSIYGPSADEGGM